jgi:hypothetical protein
MTVPIPDEIKYLQPVIDKLNEFDPDELGDDNPEAMDLVDKAIQPIIKDLTEDEAKELIKNHNSILQEWLQQAGLSDSPAFYIQGVLMGILMFKYNDYSFLTDGAE